MLKSQILPRVLIDARMVGRVPHGIARYVSRLAAGLRGLDQKLEWQAVFLVSPSWADPDFYGFEIVRTDIAFLARMELFKLPIVIRAAGAALYHSPSFSSLPSWSLDCPWVQTIHDLNHLRFGNWKQKIYYRWLLRPFARKAAALATVSAFSKTEIAPWLGVAPAQIEVVSNALEPELLKQPSVEETAEVLARHGLEPQRYFFCLSNDKPHKNLRLLVEAYRHYQKRTETSRSLKLALSVTEQPAFQADGVQMVGALTDLDVRVLRAQSVAVFFPSLYEGFGLPPVEAAIAGIPLVVSKIAPHLEGLQDLGPSEALWLNPNDLEGWSRAFSLAQEGQIAPASLESRHKILARFSERSLATHMDRIYRRVLALQA